MLERCNENLDCIKKEFVTLKDKKEQFDCPLECDSISYRISSQQFDITDEVIYIDPGEISDYKSSIVINTYFESFKVEKIVQTEKINPSEFPLVIFSTIGAFFGISLISLFEILDLIIQIFSNFVRNKIFIY